MAVEEFLGLAPAWWSVIVGVVEVLVIAASLLMVVAQLRSTNQSSNRDELLKVYQLYVDSTSVSDEYVACAELHWRDHFLPEHYEDHYRGDDDLHHRRRRSYLLMKQKYTYLVFQRWLKHGLAHGAEGWVLELVRYREFRHLHRRHKAYYPDFYAEVEKLLKNHVADHETPWMAELVDDPPETPVGV